MKKAKILLVLLVLISIGCKSPKKDINYNSKFELNNLFINDQLIILLKEYEKNCLGFPDSSFVICKIDQKEDSALMIYIGEVSKKGMKFYLFDKTELPLGYFEHNFGLKNRVFLVYKNQKAENPFFRKSDRTYRFDFNLETYILSEEKVDNLPAPKLFAITPTFCVYKFESNKVEYLYYADTNVIL